MQPVKQKKQYYDVIRVSAIGLVILGHCLTKWMLWDTPMDFTRTVIHTIYCFCPMCIGIFFMISGALLLGDEKNCSVSFVFKKRVPRVLVPAACWGAVYLIYYAADRFTQPITLSFLKNVFIKNIISMVKNSLSTPWSSHLWFIYAILAFYILLPVLCTITVHATKKQLLYMLGVWFICGCIVPMVGDFFHDFYMPNAGNINILNGYAGIFLLGFYIDRYVEKINTEICAAVFLAVIAFTIIFGSYYINAGYGFPPIHHYYSPTVLALSCCFILFIKQLCQNKPLSQKGYSFVCSLSAVTFGAYFCHELIRITLQNILINLGLSPILVIAINFVCTFILAFAAAFAASKIPYLSYAFCGIKTKR